MPVLFDQVTAGSLMSAFLRIARASSSMRECSVAACEPSGGQGAPCGLLSFERLVDRCLGGGKAVCRPNSASDAMVASCSATGSASSASSSGGASEGGSGECSSLSQSAKMFWRRLKPRCACTLLTMLEPTKRTIAKDKATAKDKPTRSSEPSATTTSTAQVVCRWCAVRDEVTILSEAV